MNRCTTGMVQRAKSEYAMSGGGGTLVHNKISATGGTSYPNSCDPRVCTAARLILSFSFSRCSCTSLPHHLPRRLPRCLPHCLPHCRNLCLTHCRNLPNCRCARGCGCHARLRNGTGQTRHRHAACARHGAVAFASTYFQFACAVYLCIYLFAAVCVCVWCAARLFPVPVEDDVWSELVLNTFRRPTSPAI